MRHLSSGLLVVAMSVGWGVVSTSPVAALTYGCEATVTPQEGPVGTSFTVRVRGFEPKPHQLSLEHMGWPLSVRPVESRFPYPSSFQYTFTSSTGDEGTWRAKGAGSNCHWATFHVGAPGQWCYIKASHTWGERIRVSGSYFVSRTDIALTFSEPVTDWTVRPRPSVTSKLFGAGHSWFSVEVRPDVVTASTLEMTATNGPCSVSSAIAIGRASGLPPTDLADPTTTESAPAPSGTPLVLGVTFLGVLVWMARRRRITRAWPGDRQA
jgi:hypothetical protein